jgi:DNA primase small subunit
LDILAPHFQTDVLQVQDPWETDEKSAELLHLLPDTTLNEALRKKWDSAPGRSSLNKWKDINAVAESGASKNLDTKALKEAKEDVILEYTYPRLDAEVSKKLNHLLKSPFCVHPGTGRVCVPIDVRKLEEFDPFSVPTVLDLLGEIDEWHREHPAHSQDEGEKKMADWEKTSLKPYVEYFRGFVNGLLRDEKPVKREADAMEF